jgi:hypothetical protein
VNPYDADVCLDRVGDAIIAYPQFERALEWAGQGRVADLVDVLGKPTKTADDAFGGHRSRAANERSAPGWMTTA